MSRTASFMKTPTLSEVKSSFAGLNEAIVGHTKWFTEWNKRVICGIAIDHQYISETSYKECYFGRWLYGKHANFLEEKPEFNLMKKLHRLVHDSMHVIARKANKGESIPCTECEDFINAEAAFSESLIHLRDEVYELLLSFDYLTGALNRQAFFHILEQEYSRVSRFSEPGCIVLLDIDNFKNINDTYGHAAGDKALISIASFIIENMRPYDSICRYGGEEFLICMPKTTIKLAHNIIDRIRDELSKKNIYISSGTCIKASASFGIAPMSATEVLKETIEHADKALYEAKTSGRNKVRVWNDQPKVSLQITKQNKHPA